MVRVSAGSAGAVFVLVLRGPLARWVSTASLLVGQYGTLGWSPRPFLLQIQNSPVEHVVVLESLAIKELLEESLQIGIIGSIFKAQGSAVFKIGSELRSVSLAKLFRAGRHLSVHDAFVLLLFGVGLESLPRK